MSTTFIDLTGRTFGNLTAVGYEKTRNEKGRNRGKWTCGCTCGGFRKVSSQRLRSGHTTHCGCKYPRTIAKVSVSRNSAEYRTWVQIRQRCYNKKHKNYLQYGGRGIIVCARWHEFKNFYEDMGPRPAGLTIDRIESNGNYEPGNCRWADMTTQNNNSSNCRWITFNGETLTLTGWANRLGIGLASLTERIQRWTLEKALTTPRKG